MRAVVCRELGPPSRLRLEERSSPEPAAGEVRVALEAWGVNFVDVLMIEGGYQHKPALPFVPGLEAAGRVSALGPGVTGVVAGQRVLVALRPGAFAEEVAVAADGLIAMPDEMTMEQGACFRSAFATAYHGLVQGARLAAGEVALVHGAAGGVGLAAVQVAKQLGATVIATGSSEAKLEVVRRYGADHVIALGPPGASRLRERVRDLAEGGADVVFDPVGGEVFDESMRCLRYGARLVVVGFVAGRPALARTNHLLIKGAAVAGIRAGEFSRRRPEVAQANLAVLLAWFRAGRIRSHVSHRFALADAAAALETIRARRAIGRVVMTRGVIESDTARET